ncbi:hypothetical protein FACS1894126_2150 [Alphaproteobacteria bacterium]|nr:hypothetical protein FACS1894126_2150 [Alphaproteobacteria bacterium]
MTLKYEDKIGESNEKTLSELIELVKHLQEKAIKKAIGDVSEIKEKY